MTEVEIAAWVAKFLAWAAMVGVELVKGSPPPTVEELAQRVEDALHDYNAAWLAEVKREADEQFEDAAEEVLT